MEPVASILPFARYSNNSSARLCCGEWKIVAILGMVSNALEYSIGRVSSHSLVKHEAFPIQEHVNPRAARPRMIAFRAAAGYLPR